MDVFERVTEAYFCAHRQNWFVGDSLVNRNQHNMQHGHGDAQQLNPTFAMNFAHNVLCGPGEWELL